jgi:hypothetical protein
LASFAAIAIAGPAFDLKLLVTAVAGERTGTAAIEDHGKKIFVNYDCTQAAPLGRLVVNNTYQARYDLETKGTLHLAVSRKGNAREISCTYTLQQ